MIHAQDQPSLPDAPSPQDAQQQTPPKEKKGDTNRAGAAAHKAEDATRNLGEKTLGKVRDWESGVITGDYIGPGRTRVPLTGAQRTDIYLQQTLTTPGAYLKRAFSAGVDQVRGVPSQWDDGLGGYAERFASREGQFITANSLAALGNAALKYEPRYDVCHCAGFRRRTWHAILRNFVTYDESENVLHPQWALYGGAFGGGVVSMTWKAHPRNAFAEGGLGMLGQAGYGTLLNFVTEYAIDINRKIGGRKGLQSSP